MLRLQLWASLKVCFAHASCRSLYSGTFPSSTSSPSPVSSLFPLPLGRAVGGRLGRLHPSRRRQNRLQNNRQAVSCIGRFILSYLRVCRRFNGEFIATICFTKAPSIGGIILEHENKRQRTGYQSSRSRSSANPTPEQLQTTISYHAGLDFTRSVNPAQARGHPEYQAHNRAMTILRDTGNIALVSHRQPLLRRVFGCPLLHSPVHLVLSPFEPTVKVSSSSRRSEISESVSTYFQTTLKIACSPGSTIKVYYSSGPGSSRFLIALTGLGMGISDASKKSRMMGMMTTRSAWPENHNRSFRYSTLSPLPMSASSTNT